MIRVAPTDLSPRAVSRLRAYQAKIDAKADYAARVAAAKATFENANSGSNRTFAEIRATLEKMCAGAARCMYCEDSASDEVEHHRPKGLYPELAFVWPNYLYACGPCNNKKLNRFAVFAGASIEVDVTRKRGMPIVPPVSGDPLLISPRDEDPLTYLTLELAGTFSFLPRASQNGSREYRRAEYTIEVLALNRDVLLRARREAYHSYRARLHEYASATSRRRQPLAAAIKRMCHPTVWHEMRRQRADIPELAKLFNQVPEALNW